MGRLDGKVIIITGGARGQGEAECKLFTAEGARVVITDVLDDEASAVAKAAGATFIHHDVSDEAGWRRVVELTVGEYGAVTGLVNNAGIYRPEGLLACDMDTYRRVTEVNQTSAYLGMRAVAGPMAASGGGSIVNVSSVAGFIGQPVNFAYTAAKWAIRGMTRSAAIELAPSGIRVNSIHPGPIDTPMVRNLRPAGSEPPGPPPRVPLGRRGTAEEVALLVLYLLSDESSYCTGSEIVIDGGMIAG
ncbi:MAG: glucose 1-dehydrogenase [Chloroflexi bacterium]|nr:glucose 1-dehydrogenase [Chloroflexota bacterium]